MALPTLDATFASAADLPRRQMLAKWLVNSSFSGSIEDYWTLPEHHIWSKIAVATGCPRTEADYVSLPKNYVWSDIYNTIVGNVRIVVSGLGDSQYNGDYVFSGRKDGYPYYVKSGVAEIGATPDGTWRFQSLSSGDHFISEGSGFSRPWFVSSWEGQGISPSGLQMYYTIGNSIDRGEKEAIAWIAAATRGDEADMGKVATYISWPWRYQVASINTYLQKEYGFVTNNVANQDEMANYMEFLKRLNVWDDINFYRDFASAKSLNHGLGPSINFTRATNATYFDSNGVMQLASEGQPRFDHDPSTLECLGLLIEEQRTNYIEYSSDFGNAYWEKINITLGNNSTSPDGTTNANSILETTTNGFHIARVTGILTVNSVYTVSVFAKANGRSKFALQVGGERTADFDLVAVTATPVAETGSPSASITSVGNGWFRCTATRQSTTNGNATILLLNDGGNAEYAGNASLGMYFWGAQAEAGAFATSYIPTTGSEMTRNADSAVVEPISSFYNQSEGTFVTESSYAGANSATNDSNRVTLQVDDTTLSNRFLIYNSGLNGSGTFLVLSSVEGASTPDSLVVGVNVPMKFGAAYNTNDLQAAKNGTLGANDNTVTIPTVSRMRIGASGGASLAASLNGHIRKVAYYPKRLPNSTLQALTT